MHVIALRVQRDRSESIRHIPQRGRVGNAGQKNLHITAVHNRLRLVVSPPRAHLRFAVEHREDLHSQATSRSQPLLQRSRGALAHLVQQVTQRTNQPPASFWPIAVAVRLISSKIRTLIGASGDCS